MHLQLPKIKMQQGYRTLIEILMIFSSIFVSVIIPILAFGEHLVIKKDPHYAENPDSVLFNPFQVICLKRCTT